MRKSISLTLVALFTCLSFAVSAQQKVEFGGFAGFANYQGDLADENIQIGETKVSFGGIVRYHVQPKFIIRGSLFFGQITGDDANSETLASRGYSFKANVLEASLIGEYNILGKPRFNNAGVFNRQVSPYVFLGIGSTVAEAELSFKNADDADKFPEVNDTGNFIVVPVGAGLRLDLLENVTLGFELGWRNTFSDYLDSVSINGRADNNDWYLFGGTTLTFLFGGPEEYNF